MDKLDASQTVPSELPARALWSELAAAARLPAESTGEAVGRGLDSSAVDAVAEVLPALLEVMRMTEAAATEYAGEVAAVVVTMPALALSKVLEKLDIPDRRRALRTAARLLPPTALVPLVVAAAPAYGQLLSVPFSGLLTKLAARATAERGGSGAKAEEAFRVLVQHLNDRWAASLLSTSAAGYDLLLHQELPEVSKSALAPGATRLVQLALETGTVGPAVWLALRSLVETEEGTRSVVEMLKRAEPSLASRVITEQIATPTRLTLLLRENPIDWEAADPLIRQLGVKAARPLIDELVLADTRVLRRAIMDRIVQLGPEIHQAVIERIADERWFVVRNMVVLLRESGSHLEPVLADGLATHPDARVRREVLLLRLEGPAARERALSDGLRDPDKQVLRTALHAAGSNLPGSGVLVLARRVNEPDFPPELRVLALHLLARSSAPAALEALLKVAAGGKTLLGRSLLAPKSPELLAALTGLARSWPRDQRAQDFVKLARKTGDPEIIAAITLPPGQETP